MKIILGLLLVVLCFSSTYAEHEIDILDVACAGAFYNLTQKLMNQNSTFTP